MPADALIVIYVAGMLAALGAVAFYSARRSRQFGPTPSKDHVFRCKQCGFVYTDDADVDRSRCSQCGKMNAAIEF
jgi:predicted Zn-ribbon and HTH transcriptional regulator